MGAALVPRLAANANERDTVALPLGETIPPRLIEMVWNAERYRSTASRSFVEITAALCERLASS
jgi:DNA-binding transcriptional LysR family regulator